jgi:hypothetical protein
MTELKAQLNECDARRFDRRMDVMTFNELLEK